MPLQTISGRYEALAFDAATGTFVDVVPFRSLGWSKALNSQGTASIVVPLDSVDIIDAPAQAGDPSTEIIVASDAALAEGATVVYLTRDGTPFHGVFIWGSEIDSSGESITYSGKDWTSYLHRIHVERDLRFLLTDERLIATGLVNYAMSKPGAAQGLEVPAVVGTAKIRDREFSGIERARVGEALEQLGEVSGGFQFRYSFEFADSTTDSPAAGMRSFFDMIDDPLGRRVDGTLELYRNAEVVRLTSDASELTTTSEAWATAQGDTGLFAREENTGTGLPLLESVATYPNVTRLSTLRDKARFVLGRNDRPVRRLSVTIGADPDLPVNSFDVGDRIEVRGSHGALELAGEWRIVELGGNVAEDGTETIGATLVPAHQFSPIGGS